jgi:hypothetical protein
MYTRGHASGSLAPFFAFSKQHRTAPCRVVCTHTSPSRREKTRTFRVGSAHPGFRSDAERRLVGVGNDRDCLPRCATRTYESYSRRLYCCGRCGLPELHAAVLHGASLRHQRVKQSDGAPSPRPESRAICAQHMPMLAECCARANCLRLIRSKPLGERRNVRAAVLSLPSAGPGPRRGGPG